MRIIAHVDMDAFFAAVEERDHPWLAGMPLVVGADPDQGRGRGVVSTANYRARAYGIRSAMPISEAWQRSERARVRGNPTAVFLIPNFSRYNAASAAVMKIIRRYAPSMEEASIDEAYVDLSSAKNFSAAKTMCRNLKEQIMAEEKLTCSIGIGPNKLIAKIASDMQKPDGLTVVEPKHAEKFLEPLAIRKIPGIGPKTELLFRKKGIAAVRDLKKFSSDEMADMLGKWGTALYEKIRGRDNAPIEESGAPKSIGEQETFASDTREPTIIFERLAVLSCDVHRRMRAQGFKSFKAVAITVRFFDFETKSRSRTLARAADSASVLHFEAMKLLTPFLDTRENPRRKSIRLIGVRIEKLSPK